MPDVEFVLAGDGPLRANSNAKLKFWALGIVSFFWEIGRDIPAVMASLDVAVLTSDSESFSNVILEAMAAGLPVVAYRVGGNPELVTLTMESSSGRTDLRGRRSRICGGGRAFVGYALDARAIGQNARKFAEENFSLDNVRACYEACYRELLEKKGVRTSLGTWQPNNRSVEKTAEGCHRRAQPELCWRAVGPGRPVGAFLAGRSGCRDEFHRR